MKSILSIDTSTSEGKVALLVDNSVLYENSFTSERSHNSQIFNPLEAALNLCERKPSLIVVGTGPGSYTGVRIGIAASLGISMAKGVKIIGIPSICSAETEKDIRSYSFVGDARRGEAFIVNVKDHELVSSTEIVKSDESLSDKINISLNSVYTFDTGIHSKAIKTKPSAVKLANLAYNIKESEIQRLSLIQPIPLYIRGPFITKPKKIGKTGPKTISE